MFLVNSSSRYNFSRKNRDDAATRYLTIKDLQSSDKGVYKCIVEKDDGTFTKNLHYALEVNLSHIQELVGYFIGNRSQRNASLKSSHHLVKSIRIWSFVGA